MLHNSPVTWPPLYAAAAAMNLKVPESSPTAMEIDHPKKCKGRWQTDKYTDTHTNIATFRINQPRVDSLKPLPPLKKQTHTTNMCTAHWYQCTCVQYTKTSVQVCSTNRPVHMCTAYQNQCICVQHTTSSDQVYSTPRQCTHCRVRRCSAGG